MNYDFSQLDDKEFEELVNDLLEKAYNTKIDSFKAWRDKWIDGKFFYDDNKTAIIQTKQYFWTWYKGLISILKKNEVNKVQNLYKAWKLDKYIFVTDLWLTDENKDEIKKIFHPYIKCTDDIFNKKNLNKILSQNKEIERKYYRLWISSINIYDTIINNAILWRSEFKFKKIINKNKIFVETNSFSEALKKLEKNRVIIITWEPWIWKSTLSENLCLKLVSQYGYEYFDMKEWIKEAEDMCIKWKKRLFYYDDFLWRNYLDAIKNEKWSHIVDFIDRINQSKDKLFILNSRTNILNYWKIYSDIFQTNEIKNNEFVLNIKDITEYEKAKILYKHIYHSNLPNEYIDKIYEDKNYKKIIKHNKFNPRIIEFITNKENFNIEPENYFTYMKNSLDNPKDIWKNSFENQADEHIRMLVALVVFNWWYVWELTLKKSYERLSINIKTSLHTPKDFYSIIEEIVWAFLNRWMNSANWTILYDLFNPSIADYMLDKYIKNWEKLKQIFQAIESYSWLRQLESLWWKVYSKINNKVSLSNNLYKEILEYLIYDIDLLNKDFEYIIYLAKLCFSESIWKDKVLNILQLFINNYKAVSLNIFIEVIELIDNNLDKLNIESSSFLNEHIIGKELDLDLDEEHINIIWWFLDKLNSRYNYEYDSDLLYYFKESIEWYLIWKILDSSNDIDLKGFIDIEYDQYTWEININYDDEKIKDEIIYLTEDYLTNINQLNIVSNMNIDLYNIYSEACINITNLADDYIRNTNSGDYDKEKFSSGTSILIDYSNDIDELFHRV